MGANKHDGWTHGSSCLCYHDNQCPRPTRFYPRYIQNRSPGAAFGPATWDPESPKTSSSLDRLRNRCRCPSKATPFGDLGTGSVQLEKSSSLVNLSPEVISMETKIWQSPSMWSLPADGTVAKATVNNDPDVRQVARAYKWQPSYSSGSGLSPYQEDGHGKYAVGKPRISLLKKMGKAARWLRALGERTKKERDESYGGAKSVRNINSRVAELVESCYDLSLNGLSSDVDVDPCQGSTSSGASSVDVSRFSEQRTYSLPSLKDKRSDGGRTKRHQEPLSRSVDGLLCGGGLRTAPELCMRDVRGKHSELCR